MFKDDQCACILDIWCILKTGKRNSAKNTQLADRSVMMTETLHSSSDKVSNSRSLSRENESLLSGYRFTLKFRLVIENSGHPNIIVSLVFSQGETRAFE